MGIIEFGKNPNGERAKRIKSSPNFRDGQFQNLTDTPQFAENQNLMGIIVEKLFKKFPNLRPTSPIPNVKTDLHQLDLKRDVLIWFGHSSYYLQIDGLRILVDPAFSGNAFPVSNTIKSFKGSNIYSVSDIPNIDYLLITHDHYDHLDYKTLIALKSKVKNVICGLGTGSHLEYWGYDARLIIEKDWGENLEIKKDIQLFVEPARHFSGRGLTRNKTLWVSYVLQTPSMKIYLGGDSGYDSHFAEIGNKHGPFDLVILENGQYNKSWPYIHMTPDQVLKAAKDLKAKQIFPVHSGKFSLSNHPWNEPLKMLTELNKNSNFSLVTPKIGEVVDIADTNQSFEQWWLDVK